ncbi:MAG: hypothetical protein E4H30_06165 [Methanomassiliicoccus sp.]|nr:MAG: hypothetical protein E4H30_06165 [Methanomassiliicoccus sp.]
MLDDVKLEKFIELFYDHMRANLDYELRETCPALKDLGELLIMIKESNNEELALQLGLVRNGGWKCPCGK